MDTQNYFDRIALLRCYKENWGSYGEKAVNPESCEKAREFVLQFEPIIIERKLKLFIYPTAGGYIGIEWAMAGSDYAALFPALGADYELYIDEDIELHFDTVPELIEQLT